MKNPILFLFCVVFSTLPQLSLSVCGQTGRQNLVVNPSFETAADSGQLIPPGEFSVTKAQGWTLPTRAQASLFSSIPTIATGNRSMSRWKFTAKEGNNVAGIMTYGTVAGNEQNELREYIQGSFTRPLTFGKKYYVSYWAHFHCEGTNNIGISFVTTPLSTDSVFRLPLKPLVNYTALIPYTTATWQIVQDSFIAREAYKHFIMGNFLSNRQTRVESNKYHYHKAYIDDILIEEAPDDKMPPHVFDLATENEINKPAIIKTPPPSVSSVLDNKNTDNTTLVKGETLILDKVFFGYNSTILETESSNQLDKLLIVLQESPTVHILIKGHSSSEGGDAYNQRLSENRARSVAHYLTQKGINGERLSYKGYGKSQPIYPNDTEENRQKNRRVEFEIIHE